MVRAFEEANQCVISEAAGCRHGYVSSSPRGQYIAQCWRQPLYSLRCSGARGSMVSGPAFRHVLTMAIMYASIRTGRARRCYSCSDITPRIRSGDVARRVPTLDRRAKAAGGPDNITAVPDAAVAGVNSYHHSVEVRFPASCALYCTGLAAGADSRRVNITSLILQVKWSKAVVT